MIRIIGITYGFLSVLFFLSYRGYYRKKIWTSYYDAEDLKLVPECADKGYYEIRYTLLGAIFRSIGVGGIVALVMRYTSIIWMNLLSLMTLDVFWQFFTSGWEVVVLCSVATSIVYFWKIRSKIMVA